MAKNNLRVSMEVAIEFFKNVYCCCVCFEFSVLAGLKEKYAEAMMLKIFFSNIFPAYSLKGDGGRFSGGFDISVFGLIHQTEDLSKLPDVSVDFVCNTIEDAKKPSVASIEGHALRGGLKLTMGCHGRIAAPKVHLGLRELTLGVIPGFGGTERLLRMVGSSKAIEMLVILKLWRSKFIISEEGIKIGFIDAIVSEEEFGSLAESRKVIQVAREQAKRTAPNMPQHQACLDDVPNVTDIGLRPRPIKKVAVIGGGLMGSRIAKALTLSNVSVVLKEINPAYLHKGIKTVEVARGKMTENKAKKALSILTGSIPLKQSTFSELEKVWSPNCILALNTSQCYWRKDEISRLHYRSAFFCPAHVMPLLEIVRTDKTYTQVILDFMTVGKTIKKVCVVVGNWTGFAVNGTFFSYTQGAHILANLGVDVFRIERLISSFGFLTAFLDQSFKSPLVELLLIDGRNGKIIAKGYYEYKKGSKPKPDLTVLPIIKELIKLTGYIYSHFDTHHNTFFFCILGWLLRMSHKQIASPFDVEWSFHGWWLRNFSSMRWSHFFLLSFSFPLSLVSLPQSTG
ncbi:hypothetical protein MKX03_023196 [Papaver bracteatum]|nr:hypothetical protein MKX03_023196 [Papaver bracteatum]